MLYPPKLFDRINFPSFNKFSICFSDRIVHPIQIDANSIITHISNSCDRPTTLAKCVIIYGGLTDERTGQEKPSSFKVFSSSPLPLTHPHILNVLMLLALHMVQFQSAQVNSSFLPFLPLPTFHWPIPTVEWKDIH